MSGSLHEDSANGTNTSEGDDFLDDLELRQAHAAGEADAVRRHHQQVLEQGDAPARERGDEPGTLLERTSRWPYQAKVMKTFEAVSSATMRSGAGMESIIDRV